jgi:translocation and assembly module TamB
VKTRNLKLPRLVHWLIYAAGVVLVIVAGVVGVASTGWFRKVLEQKVEQNLTRLTGGKVEIEGMGFHPLSLNVSMRRLVIHGLEKDTAQPLFTAHDVDVNVSPKSLIQFRLLLRTLQWQWADLHIQTYPDGSTNLPGPAVTPIQGQDLAKLLDLGIERATFSHTTLQWNNRRIPFDVAARSVAIQLHVDHDHEYFGTLASSDTVLNWSGRTTPPVLFATSFKLSSNRLRVSALSWQIANLRGNLAGDLRWSPQPTASFDFRTNGGLQELARALKLAPLESGYVYADGKGAYGSSGLSVKGRMQARDLKASTTQFKPGTVNFSADYKITGERLDLSNIVFAALKGRAEGKAAISIEKGKPRAVMNGRFRGVSLSALMDAVPRLAKAVGIFHPEAVISGNVDANWQERSPLQSRFEIQFRPPANPPHGSLPLSGQAQGSLRLGREVMLALDTSQISTAHSTIESQGTLGSSGASLAIKFVTSDFEEWRPGVRILIETRNPLPLTLHSQAVFTGSVSGTFSNPKIVGQISAGTFNFGGWAWDGFQASLIASPQRAQIQSGRLRLGKSLLVLDADAALVHWKLEPNSAVQLRATARETPVGGLRAALNLKPAMEGLVSGEVEAHGTVENLSGHGQIAVHKGQFAGVPFDSLSASINATKSNWEISDIKLVEGRGHAEGRLQINLPQRTFSANLHGREFSLERIHLLNPQQVNAKGSPGVSGLVSFDLEGQGTFDNARLHSELAITGLTWKGQSLGSIRGNAEWQGQQISLDVKGGGGQAGEFHISGVIEARDNWPLQLSGQYSNFRADPWIEEFSGHAMAAAISAGGSIKVNGPLKDPQQLAGSSQIQQLQVEFPALKLTNTNPVEISYADRNLTLKRFRLQGEATNFEVDGSVHLGHPPSIDLSARGKAAATLLRLSASNIQATGESDLEVKLQGPLAEPRLSGEIQVRDVGLGYSDLPFRLNALNGTIKLEGERATISSLKGTVGGGAVNISGFAMLQEPRRYQLRVQLSQARVRYPSDFTSVLDGNLTFAGTPEQGQISGTIAVRNLFANENLNLADLLSGPNPFSVPPSTNTSHFASSVNLNVGLTSVRPVRIETRDLRLVSDIQLQVEGTLANPVIVGNVFLRSGDAIFRGNRYTLARGDISMTNPFRTEPILDLQVRTNIDKYDLTLEISGPPDQLRFSYRSDPPLPTQDILSLLAFGYSRRLEEFAPEARNPFSTASAGALLSQALSSQITGRIQRLFGVSRIKFSPTSSELGTLGGPVLTVEQQISSALTLTYETSTANSQYRVIEFEYAISPRMSIRGFRDQNGIFGLELKFRKRFK